MHDGYVHMFKLEGPGVGGPQQAGYSFTVSTWSLIKSANTITGR